MPEEERVAPPRIQLPIADPPEDSEVDEILYGSVSDRLDAIDDTIVSSSTADREYTDTTTDTTVDTVIGNIFDLRTSVSAVVETNITLSGLQTLDGFALSSGDLILAAGQSSAAQNGVYTVASGAWSRWTGADSDGELTVGFCVRVNNADSDHNNEFWLLMTNNVSVGVTDQDWTAVADLAPAFVVILDALIRYFLSGNGEPEGAVTASIGAMYFNLLGGASSTFWIKESGSGNTGWASANTTPA